LKLLSPELSEPVATKNTDKIYKDLRFPKVRAALCIPQAGEFSQAGGWYIHLCILGPNLRYTPASILIFSHDVQKFYQVLQQAVMEMQRLERENPSAAFPDFILQTKEIASNLSLHISFDSSEYLKRPERKVSLCFRISSRTQTFERSCTTQEVQTMLTKLEGLEEKVAALKQLSPELSEPLATRY